jgi:hypothetical protein
MPEERKSLLDELVSGIGNAVTDIREKVVEEAWFGKAVTAPDTEPRLWQQREAETAPSHQQELERDREAASKDIDIDR